MLRMVVHFESAGDIRKIKITNKKGEDTMKRNAKQALALCTMLASGTVLASTTWNNGGGDRAWSTPSNWDNGLPTNQDAIIEGNIAPDAQPIVSSTNATAQNITMDNGATLDIEAGASLHNTGKHVADDTSGNYSITTVSGTYIVDGSFLLGGWNSGGKGRLVINSGGTVTCASSTWFIAGHEENTEGEIIINGGTLQGEFLIKIGNFGSGSLTLNGGFVDASHYLYIASEGTTSSGQITINDGLLSTEELYIGTKGSATIDFNGGRLIVKNGLTQGPNATFNFATDGGELVINDGSSVAEVNDAIDNGAGTWNFAGQRSVTETAEGVVVKSISIPTLEAARIISTSVSNNLMKLVILTPTGPNYYYPLASDNLASNSWARIPHSNNGIAGSFLETNLEYSATDSSSNAVIYLQINPTQEFFKIEGAQP